MTDDAVIRDAVDLAHALADDAREVTLSHFRQPLAVEDKADSTPVTQADQATERLLREKISARFPDHGIVGEEFGAHQPDAAYVWIVDPIDGTGSYICGNPLYGTLISLVHQRQPVLGVIDMPALQERWIGSSVSATERNGVASVVSQCQRLDDARILATTPEMFNADEWPRIDALRQRCHVRRYGGDCYNYALLASGHADIVVESDLKPYDYMALVAVIEGAGGVISDWQGQPLRLGSGAQVIAAATPELHAQALPLLN